MKSFTRKNEHDYRSINVPSITPVPTLTTEDDQHYLYWLASTQYQGIGVAVEIGTWFGSSAGYLAAGLAKSGTGGTLYCYDRFSFRESDTHKALEQGFDFSAFHVGDDTRPFVQQHLVPLYDSTHLITSEIEHIQWNCGPIELLHLDAPKRWIDIIKVLEVFGPFLIEGKTIVVLQDFCMPRAYALPLIFGALADSFELVHVPSEHSTMAVFVYKKKFVIDEHLNIDLWPAEKAIKTVETVACAFNAEQQSLLNLGLQYYFNRNSD